MAQIQIRDMGFIYTGSLQPVFEHVDLELDTNWRLGLVGRNGRGKTTFLRILKGELEYTGGITSPVQFDYFPVAVTEEQQTALQVARNAIAPFDVWRERMDALANAGTLAAMDEYGEIEHQFAAADGYVIDESIAAEAGKLGIVAEVLHRPYKSLSGGEQVKLLLAALFLKKHSFLLIDEPTDHLDAEGRRLVARWLAGKKGFILVSHDRAFLDEAVDHILSINRADIELQRGNYSSWRHNRAMQDQYEADENKRLEGEIHNLKAAAARTAKWSDNVERSKIGEHAADRGHIGHMAAKMMQRSKSIERRRNRQIEEKAQLLKNIETVEPLRFHVLDASKDVLLRCENLALSYGTHNLFNGLSFTLKAGERIAVKGGNGSGKTSLLRIICGQQSPTAGNVSCMSGLVTSTLEQDTSRMQGTLQSYAAAIGVDYSLFLTLLRKLDFEREAFARSMEQYSAGQKKKVCLAASMAKPAHLFIWDEPLNYVDILSREQIEQAVLSSQPTMLFVEHDDTFTRAVATGSISL